MQGKFSWTRPKYESVEVLFEKYEQKNKTLEEGLKTDLGDLLFPVRHIPYGMVKYQS